MDLFSWAYHYDLWDRLLCKFQTLSKGSKGPVSSQQAALRLKTGFLYTKCKTWMYTTVSAYSHVPLFCHVARTWVACSVSSLLGTDLFLLRSSLLGISARMTAWWHVYWLHREHMGKSKEILIYWDPNPTWKRGQLRPIPLIINHTD